MLLTSFCTQDWNPDLHASKVWALAEGLVYPSMNHPANSKKKQIRYAKCETSHHNREDILKTYTSRAGCLEQFVSIKFVLKERFTIKKKRGKSLMQLIKVLSCEDNRVSSWRGGQVHSLCRSLAVY